jgi:hypothetical protein
MLLAIPIVLPLIVLPLRMVMRGPIAIMTLGVVVKIRANPRYARNRTDRAVKHRQSEHDGDDLGARWADDDHEPEYNMSSLRSVRLQRKFHFGLPILYSRNGWRVCPSNSLGRGSNSPASLDRAAQSTRSRYCSNSVISPNHCVPFSFEIVTTSGRSHGPRQPLIVNWTLFSNSLERHFFLSHSTGTGGLPFSVFPQQHPWHSVRCRFVA